MTLKTDPAASALLVIDMQNDFCHADGALARGGADVSGAREIVPRLASLVDGARAARVPVVWVRTWRDDTTDSPVWRSRRSALLDAPPGERPAPNCVRGTWGAEFYGVAPAPHEAVVDKIRYSAFVGTPLETALRALGRPSLLFSGVTTNVCVESTLRDAFFREFHTTIVEDCCAATSPGEHDMAVDNVRRYFGQVASSAALLAAWSARRS